MSYSHEWRMHQHHFWGPRPLGPWGGAKRSNIIKPELQSFSKVFKPNFVILLTNERYITYQTGFSFGRLGHAQAWELGVPWGWGVKNFFFRNSTRFGVLVTHMNGTCTGTIFGSPPPPPPCGLGEGSKI